MILDSTYFDKIYVLLHYVVVDLLRIQSIIFYIVVNITTSHTLTDYTDVKIALLLYRLPELDVRINRHVFEMVHTFISGSKIFTDLLLLDLLIRILKLNLNMFYKTFCY